MFGFAEIKAEPAFAGMTVGEDAGMVSGVNARDDGVKAAPLSADAAYQNGGPEGPPFQSRIASHTRALRAYAAARVSPRPALSCGYGL